VGTVYLLGHLAFGLQGVMLGKRTGRPATALPMGVNIVPFFAYTHLLMAPTYRRLVVRARARARARPRARARVSPNHTPTSSWRPPTAGQ